MASIVIVTSQCYLLCEAINYIAINEIDEDGYTKRELCPEPKGRSKKPKKKQVREQQFQIVISFIPAHSVSSNGMNHSLDAPSSVSIRISGRDRCLKLFSHMVEQIREQIPDNKFLDDIVSKFLQEE